ncbi:hypothetical protein GCM10018782_47260 [Streptomyces griseoaurantiacus]|nr:hypothetical protein GCM10018782_47260 [Streptomyces griseoaurantiacus]
MDRGGCQVPVAAFGAVGAGDGSGVAARAPGAVAVRSTAESTHVRYLTIRGIDMVPYRWMEDGDRCVNCPCEAGG